MKLEPEKAPEPIIDGTGVGDTTEEKNETTMDIKEEKKIIPKDLKPLMELPHEHSVSSITFNNKGDKIFTGGRVYNIISFSLINRLGSSKNLGK